MSSSVERDLVLADQLGVRSIFYNENATVQDYEFTVSLRPEFHVISHLHFESVLRNFDSDAEYLDVKMAESGVEVFDYKVYLTELPSQNLLDAGEIILYKYRNNDEHFLHNGIFQNSDKIKYRRVWLDAPLEQQGPFHAIICKLITLFKKINDQSSIDKIHKLETYCTENNIPLISKFEHVKHLLTRYSCNSAANVFFTSSECKAICEEFGKVARTSKMIFISKTDNSDKDYVEQLMKHADIEFPIVIKSNRTINCSLAHSKYFVHDSDGLDGLYSDEKFMSDDLVA